MVEQQRMVIRALAMAQQQHCDTAKAKVSWRHGVWQQQKERKQKKDPSAQAFSSEIGVFLRIFIKSS